MSINIIKNAILYKVIVKRNIVNFFNLGSRGKKG